MRSCHETLLILKTKIMGFYRSGSPEHNACCFGVISALQRSGVAGDWSVAV
jgi:hypothetical protein